MKGGAREKAEKTAPRFADSEPYDLARKLYEDGNPAMRAKIGSAFLRNRDRVFAAGTDDPLGDLLKKHGVEGGGLGKKRG